MPTLLVVGYGPGISGAVASKFASEGLDIVALARNGDRLARAVADLRREGVRAQGYACDASDPVALVSALETARSEMGPITAVLWTAFGFGLVPDVLAADADSIAQVFGLGVASLLTTVQVLRHDLEHEPDTSLLVVNGALGEDTDSAANAARMFGADGVALENSAKAKMVGLLRARLAEADVFVGQVTIAGTIAGTPTASPTAITPSTVADVIWAMHHERSDTRVRLEEQT